MSVPEDPITQLQAGVAQQHEMFMAYVEAGFTRNEALRILISVIISMMTSGEEE